MHDRDVKLEACGALVDLSAQVSQEICASQDQHRACYSLSQERSAFFSTWPPQHVPHRLSVGALRAQDLFQEGDRVRCLVTFVDEGSHKISLSTSDLEEVDGDMILNQVPAACLTIAERHLPCWHPSIRRCRSSRSASAPQHFSSALCLPVLQHWRFTINHVSHCCCSAMTCVLLRAGEGPCSCR